MAHDSPTSGHFEFSKTKERLGKFYWPKTTRDVRSYIQGFYDCQGNKSGNEKQICFKRILEAAKRKWDTIFMAFIIKLLTTKNAFDSIITLVDTLSKGPNLVPCKTTYNVKNKEK